MLVMDRAVSLSEISFAFSFTTNVVSTYFVFLSSNETNSSKALLDSKDLRIQG